jgi:hypothetical protein
LPLSWSTGTAVAHWASLLSQLVSEHGPQPRAIQNTIVSNDP